MLPIVLLTLILPLSALPCTNVMVTTMMGYNALPTTLAGCASVSSLTLTNLPVTHINLTVATSQLTVSNCPLLTSVHIAQLPISASQGQLTFINNSQLVTYVLNISTATNLFLAEVPYPALLSVTPFQLLVGVGVANSAWTDVNILAPYILNTLTLQNLPLTTLNLKPRASLNLLTLPLTSLDFLLGVTSLQQLILNGLPGITSFNGLKTLQTVGYLVVTNMPHLRDISAVSGLHATRAVWDPSLRPCCPDIATGFYGTWSTPPTCMDCFQVTSVEPQHAPLAGGYTTYLNYTGSVRTNAIQVEFFTTVVTCTRTPLAFVCPVPPVSAPQTMNLAYSINGSPYTSLNTSFSYVRWQDWVRSPPALTSDYLTASSLPILPLAGSDYRIYLSLWLTLLMIAVGITAWYLLKGLPLYLDVIGTPELTKLPTNAMIAARRKTPQGAWFTLIASLIFLGVLITSLVDYGINNTWSVESVISPNSLDISTNWAATITLRGSSCRHLTYTATGFSAPGTWHINNNTIQGCTATWTCQGCTPKQGQLSVHDLSWEDYLYGVTWSLSTPTGNVAGAQSVNASDVILKGNIGSVVILAMPLITQTSSTTTVETTLSYGAIQPLLQTNASNYASTNQMGLDLIIQPTQFWRQFTITSKQSFIQVLAQLMALSSGIVTGIRLIMFGLAKRIQPVELNPKPPT